VTGALARIITHWREVAAPHGCHFENYLAKDLRIIAPLLLPCGRRLGVSAKRSISGYHPRNVRESWAEDIKRTKMIAGQESGSARHAGRTGAGCAAYVQRRPAT
jgi:hypothetical protein